MLPLRKGNVETHPLFNKYYEAPNFDRPGNTYTIRFKLMLEPWNYFSILN